MALAVQPRNRLDHIMPRSYLDGFTNQGGQLSVFDCQAKRWFEAAPVKVGAERGYYDYSPDSVADQTADEAFNRLESGFPAIRNALAVGTFEGWVDHRQFLLEYAQMLRARSRLFRGQVMTQARTRIIGVVEEVVAPTVLKVRAYASSEEPKHEQYLRNLSITEMRREIAKGAALFSSLHWCLRTTNDVSNPVITADQPIIVLGPAGLSEEALTRDPSTWVIFPLCRKACLIGNCEKIDTDTEAFQPSGVKWLRGQFFRAETGFIYSPSRVDTSPSEA
jgi:hypothetical protein